MKFLFKFQASSVLGGSLGKSNSCKVCFHFYFWCFKFLSNVP